MTQCDHVQSRIAFYLDDEFREQERVEVEDHLQSCARGRGLCEVDTRLRRLRGQIPLEIVSDSALEISAWFIGKVAFALKLPNHQEASGQEKLYRLEGARMVAFRNNYAAYVAYQMRRHLITLVVTSNSVALPAGGEEIVSKGLRFHYDSINGFKVITWADRGLTYALVSDLDEHGQQPCLVCHAGAKDFIESLKPAHQNQ